MHRFFSEAKQDDRFLILDESDQKHILKVLRLQPGEKVEIVHEGRLYLAERTTSVPADFRLISELPVNKDHAEITLIQGYPKGQKLQDILMHGTEIGITHFVISEMKRSVAEGAERKTERFQKIVREAAKQSRSLHIPDVRVQKLQEIDFSIYDMVLFFYEESTQKLDIAIREGHIALVIGPEGGFSEEEANYLRSLPNAREARLGKRILRTETAALVAAAIIRDRLGDL